MNSLSSMGWKKTLTFLPYGKDFQQHRRMMQQYLKADLCVSYQGIQTREARILLRSLLEDYEKRENILGRYDNPFNSSSWKPSLNTRYSTSIVIAITYGHRIKSDSDSYMNMARMVDDVLHSSGPPGSTPVDFFPFCRCRIYSGAHSTDILSL